MRAGLAAPAASRRGTEVRKWRFGDCAVVHVHACHLALKFLSGCAVVHVYACHLALKFLSECAVVHVYVCHLALKFLSDCAVVHVHACHLALNFKELQHKVTRVDVYDGALTETVSPTARRRRFSTHPSNAIAVTALSCTVSRVTLR